MVRVGSNKYGWTRSRGMSKSLDRPVLQFFLSESRGSDIEYSSRKFQGIKTRHIGNLFVVDCLFV